MVLDKVTKGEVSDDSPPDASDVEPQSFVKNFNLRHQISISIYKNKMRIIL